MPFKNPAQEAAMWANAPDVARKWVHEYGHAPGYDEYRKNHPTNKKKRRKKKSTAEIIQDTERVAAKLESLGCAETAQKLRTSVARMTNSGFTRTAQSQTPSQWQHPRQMIQQQKQ